VNAYITQQAASVGAQPRRRVADERTPVARRSNSGARQTLGVALVAIGQRIAGELPAPRAAHANNNEPVDQRPMPEAPHAHHRPLGQCELHGPM